MTSVVGDIPRGGQYTSSGWDAPVEMLLFLSEGGSRVDMSAPPASAVQVKSADETSRR